MIGTWALRCKHCTERADPDAVLEAYLLHFTVEHDTDQVEFDLIAVCTCGAEMTLERTSQIGRTRDELHTFRCPHDQQTWLVRQNRRGERDDGTGR